MQDQHVHALNQALRHYRVILGTVDDGAASLVDLARLEHARRELHVAVERLALDGPTAIRA